MNKTRSPCHRRLSGGRTDGLSQGTDAGLFHGSQAPDEQGVVHSVRGKARQGFRLSADRAAVSRRCAELVAVHAMLGRLGLRYGRCLQRARLHGAIFPIAVSITTHGLCADAVDCTEAQ